MTLQEKVAGIVGAKRALYGEPALDEYALDESDCAPHRPDVVALLESEDELIELLKLSALDGIPITPRGTGTGKAGGSIPLAGGIVVSCERMNGLIDIDERNLIARVQPGIVTGSLQTAVESVGLFYPPDPASLESCSLGGNVATNAGGPRAFKYGVTREYVLGLNLGLIGGEVLSLGRQTIKGVTGLDTVALVVGSEGILGVASEVVVKLLPLPRSVAAFVARFADEATAVDAVGNIIAAGHRPRTMELLDRRVVEILGRDGSWPRLSAPSASPSALLLVELDGHDSGVEDALLSTAKVCEAARAEEIIIATDENQRRRFWQMRREVSRVLKRYHPQKVSEDIVVPPAAMAEMYRRLDQAACEFGVAIAAYGHAGDGNLHVNILAEASLAAADLQKLRRSILENAVNLGGCLSGEHGIGISKLPFVGLEHGQSALAVQRSIKKAFDPMGLMNPGKVLPPGQQT
jgi:glycolate oxidase